MMPGAMLKRHPLASFYVLAYAWTWSLALPGTLAARGQFSAPPPHWLEAVAALGPFVAALLVSSGLGGKPARRELLAGWGRWRAPLTVQLVTWLSPVLLLLLALAIAWTAGTWPAPDEARLSAALSSAALVDLVLVSAMIQAAGEEPGWRGFALPRLRRRYGPLGASLALFPVWLCWHLPFFLARPEFGLAQWLGFSLGILAATIWLTWIWENSRSLLLVFGWHALINIARGLALAISMTAFLTISNTVLLGACVIAAGWLWRGRFR